MFQPTPPRNQGSQNDPIVIDSDDDDTPMPVRHWRRLFDEDEDQEANDSGYDSTIWIDDDE